ncbi:MAG: bifunctional ornithine acetyltransferase/N-acetylglutamate synthase [Bacillota bacterium]
MHCPDGCQEIPGGVTAAPGFKAAGVGAGIKKSGLDIALIVSDVPASAAGVYTRNLIKSASLQLAMEHLDRGEARAVVVNSGNANACNGPQGFADARLMAGMVAEQLNLETDQVVVASTGVIGVPLPMERVTAGITKAVQQLAREGGAVAARAIMTTDTFPKEVAVRFNLGGREVLMGGMAKGSGMIHPNMATMLAFVTTSAAIDSKLLQHALRQAADKSFNMITVDGDTSPNDTLVILANGTAKNPPVAEENDDYRLFSEALTYICVQLAKMIARDGEGATKLIEVWVKGARTEEDACTAAKAVAGSNLVKTAMFGKDANWGRILTAVGYSGARFEPGLVDIWLSSPAGMEQVAASGGGLPFNEELARQILSRDEVAIIIDLKEGQGDAIVWSCDFSYDYVKINADYRT